MYCVHPHSVIFTVSFTDAVSSRRRDSSDDSSKAGRVGVRRVSSSRLSRESREDKYKGDQQEV